MVGRRRRIIWGIKAYWLKRPRLRLEVYDTWWISATFQFLYFPFCHYQKDKSTKRLIKWLSKSSDHCKGACAEGYCRPSLASVLMWIQLPKMLRKSVTVIPKCALAATKPSQRPVQPAPCEWQPWGPPAPWGVHSTHSVRSRQTAHNVVEIWWSVPQARTSVWRPPQRKWRTNCTEDKQTSQGTFS